EKAEMEQRIFDELQRIHDHQVANGEVDDKDADETLDPEDTAEIEQQIFGVPDAGTPPSGRGRPGAKPRLQSPRPSGERRAPSRERWKGEGAASVASLSYPT